MIKKWKIIISLVLVFVIASFSFYFLSSSYFFNPITFKQDHVTYLPWSWYKNPLSVQILTHKDEWKELYILEDKEIRFIIKELKDSQVLNEKPADLNNDSKIELYIRRYKKGLSVEQQNGTIFLIVKVYDNKITLLDTPRNTWIKMTDELWSFLEKKVAK